MWYNWEEAEPQESLAGPAPVELKKVMLDHRKPLSVFGAVPPPRTLPQEKVRACVDGMAKTIRGLQPDAVIVYDIQDEKSRSGEDRPFPFFETHESRQYAKDLEESTGVPTIVYQAIKQEMFETSFEKYAAETRNNFGTQYLVFVGASASDAEHPLPSVSDCAQEVASHGFMLGGVTIPERHRDRNDEHHRLMEKTENGIEFFTSQCIYNADNAIWMLRDYDQLCKSKGKKPARIILCFAPFGRESTMRFLRWLGVEIPEGTLKRILSRGSARERVEESNQVCWENFRRILDASRKLGLTVPLGVTVESVSKFRDEQEGACHLFNILREELDVYYQCSC